jgi:hypothetical protein|tara:strand:- start:162 stop:413 length:252 start_codon:yes stop_codon:yes gene_type:complete
MPNDLVTQLRNLANTTNRGVTNQPNQNTFLSNAQEQRIDWQLLANYLDGKIFEFIMQNQNDPRIKDFGIELARDLANKFGINH